MTPYARKAQKTSRNKRVHKRSFRSRRSTYRRLARRISAVSRRVAGEVCKFEITPDQFTNTRVVVGTSATSQVPLHQIVSGTPWIMPLNWIYQETTGTFNNVYANGSALPAGETFNLSMRNPIFYNTADGNVDQQAEIVNMYQDITPGLQYRLKYLYINALFNAPDNSDGALRIVIVKDKQPTGGSATWADENSRTNSRGVFNSNRIDAQLNPSTVGRFKIMYDKTLRFTTINSYKPFKYYKALSSVIRNNRDYIPLQTSQGSIITDNNSLNSSSNYVETSERAPPVQKNAFYLMVFSDGLNFEHTNGSTTSAGNFHLFNRVAYYNN